MSLSSSAARENVLLPFFLHGYLPPSRFPCERCVWLRSNSARRGDSGGNLTRLCTHTHTHSLSLSPPLPSSSLLVSLGITSSRRSCPCLSRQLWLRSGTLCSSARRMGLPCARESWLGIRLLHGCRRGVVLCVLGDSWCECRWAAWLALGCCCCRCRLFCSCCPSSGSGQFAEKSEWIKGSEAVVIVL